VEQKEARFINTGCMSTTELANQMAALVIT